MADLETLLEFHEIAQLKYRYLRGVDTHDWELLASCFAADAHCWYGAGQHRYSGREAIVGFLSNILAKLTSSHIALQPELKLTGPAAATGIWRIQDMVFFGAPNQPDPPAGMQGGEEMVGAGYYYDEYVKRDGEWLIGSTGYVRLFEKVSPFDQRPGVQVHLTPGRGVKPEKL